MRKRTAERMLAPVLALALALSLLAGCGGQTSTAPETPAETTAPAETSVPAEPVSPEPESADEAGEPELDAEPDLEWEIDDDAEPQPELLDLNSLEVFHWGDFSEGLAWVQYYEFGDVNAPVTVLTDRYGAVVYETRAQHVLYASKMQDGYSFLRICDDWPMGPPSETECYELVIGADGTEHYRTEQTDSASGFTGEHILCQGDGKFVVLRHETGIDGARYTLGTVDADGREIDPFTVDSWAARNGNGTETLDRGTEWLHTDLYMFLSEYWDDEPQNLRVHYYMGDGIFRLVRGEHHFFYVPERGLLVDGETMDGPVADGWLLNHDESSGHLVRLSRVDFTELMENGYRSRDDEFYYYDQNTRDRSYGADLAGPVSYDGGVTFANHGYMNAEGERVLEITQHAESGMWCSAMHDGRALCIVRGVDGNTYATVLDETGAETFEPFRITYTYQDFYGTGDFSHGVGGGYFAVRSMDGVLGLYDLQGNLVRELGGSDPAVFSITDEYILYRESLGHMRCLFFDTL